MKLSGSVKELREIIEKAMVDHQISKSEYELIIQLATADGIIDNQKRALLSELQGMIEDKTVKLVP
jgi:hypothetical protein